MINATVNDGDQLSERSERSFASLISNMNEVIKQKLESVRSTFCLFVLQCAVKMLTDTIEDLVESRVGSTRHRFKLSLDHLVHIRDQTRNRALTTLRQLIAIIHGCVDRLDRRGVMLLFENIDRPGVGKTDKSAELFEANYVRIGQRDPWIHTMMTSTSFEGRVDRRNSDSNAPRVPLYPSSLCVRISKQGIEGWESAQPIEDQIEWRR